MTIIIDKKVIIKKCEFGLNMWDPSDFEEIMKRGDNTYFSKILKTSNNDVSDVPNLAKNGQMNKGPINKGQMNRGQINRGQINNGQANNGQANRKQMNRKQMNKIIFNKLIQMKLLGRK